MARRRKDIRGSGGVVGNDIVWDTELEETASESRAYARVIDLVSEGEIEGLANGAASIYLDEVALAPTPTGPRNFQGFRYVTRNGTQAQDHIPGAIGAENIVNVGVEVLENTPIVRSVSNANVDAVRVTISIPNLSRTDRDDGEVVATDVRYRIELSSNGGPYTKVYEKRLSGKVTTRFDRNYLVPLTGSPPWNIRVTRLSEDENDGFTQNRTFWSTYTEIISAKLRYPNSALIAAEVDAAQFQSIPRRGYDLKGLRIRVPSNTTTRADGSLQYSGTWDGTFRISWTTCPAWILYDLITAERYGLGTYIAEEQVDKWSFYEMGRYCDELVPDGFGGTEPRFSCSVYLQTRTEAFNVIQNLASVFRAMTYWAGGTLSAIQDSPRDPAALFTAANVIDGRFAYSGASLRARHSVALVTWNDPADLYRQKVEYVEDPEMIAQFGVNEIEVAAFGCCSRGQANRVGRWILYTERYESETVSFKTGIEGSVVLPGQIIAVSDPVRSGTRFGGRISSATTSTVTIDADPATTPSGGTLSCMMPDGTVESRTIQNYVDRVVSVTTPFSVAPAAEAVWLIESPTVGLQYFRVIGVTESAQGEYEISALAHDPRKYAAVEDGLVLEPRDISELSAVPASPTQVAISESLYTSGTQVRTKVTIAWSRVENVSSYRVSYRRDDGNPISLGDTSSNEVDILDAAPGVYEAFVTAISAVGTPSIPATAVREVFGKAAPPADVTNFSLIPNQGLAYLTWTKAPDLDVLVGGTVRIRHTPRTTGQRWADGVDVIPALPGTETSAQAPLLAGTYMAKFFDSSGVPSLNEALILTTVPEALALNVVETITESPSFAGTLTGMEINEELDALVLGSGLTIDEVTVDIDDVPVFDWLGGVNSTGEYLFANSIDLGGVYPVRLTALIDFEAYGIGSFVDQRDGTIDEWTDFDGTLVDQVNTTLYTRHTDDDPGGTPTWSAWKPILAAAYSARAFEFKAVMTSTDSASNGAILTLSVTVDMEDRTVSLANLTSGTGSSYRVNFPQPFREAPAVSITAFAMQSGDYYEITNRDETGFDIVFRNSGSTIVSRVFDVLAKGYGRKVG